MPSFRPEFERMLLQLALLRPSPRELIDLYELLRSIGPIEFHEFLRHLSFTTRDAVNRIDLPSRYRSHEVPRYRSQEIRKPTERPTSPALDSLHKKVAELQRSAGSIDNESLAKIIIKNLGETAKRPPRFDKKRGLRFWLGELLKIATASQIYRAALFAKTDTSESDKMSWPLSNKR